MSSFTIHPLLAPQQAKPPRPVPEKQNPWALIVAVGASLFISVLFLTLRTDGMAVAEFASRYGVLRDFVIPANFLTAGAFIFGMIVLVVTFYRIEWGFYTFIGSVLLFDQYTVTEFEPLTHQVQYFDNLKVSYLPDVGPAVFSPLELHLLLILFVWVVLIVLRQRTVFTHVPAWPAAVFFFGMLTLSFVSGLGRGGEFLPALWEVRAMFYLGILYFFIPQIITKKSQITTIMWICIISISFKAIQGIVRFVRLGFSFQEISALTNHEDAAFFVTLVIFLLCLSLFGGHKSQRRTLLLLLVPLLLGFVVSQRRAAFGSMAATTIALIVLLPGEKRRVLFRVLVPVTIALACYVAAFWSSESPIATPAQLIKASFSNEREHAGERYWSNLYRVYERYNLASTIKRAPVFGIGFGNKYDMPIELANIPFSLRDYIAHNEILWLLAKMGAIGFFAFWLYCNSFMLYAASIFSRLKDPYLKSVCVVGIIAVINQVFVSYFDLQLTFHRNMVYLALLMGLVPVLEGIERKSPEEDPHAVR